MKTRSLQPIRAMPSAIAVAAVPGYMLILLMISALLLSSCSTQQARTEPKTNSKLDHIGPSTFMLANNLRPEDFRAGGVAIITPSSITGQEEDKQALALAFTGVLRTSHPELRIVSLPETLSAINRLGLTGEYKRMFEDYRLTGIFDRDTLQKVAKITGARYLAQLKLGAFRQESRGRLGILGVRIMETKSSTIRLFLQIWDSNDGSVAWEGSQESTLSQESFAEEYISLRSVVEESARDLIKHLPSTS